MITVKYDDFRRISRKIKYEYFGKGCTYGAIRIFSKDENGLEHSLVLTRDEAKKFIGPGKIFLLTSGACSDYRRLFNNKPYYTYKEREEVLNGLN